MITTNARSSLLLFLFFLSGFCNLVYEIVWTRMFGLVFGVTVFAVSAVLAMIVMYDAAGVRQAAGKQAQKINLIVEELLNGHPLNEDRLRELLGHTPLQVAVGGLIGFVGALLLNR